MSRGDKAFVGAACFAVVFAFILGWRLQPEQPSFAGDRGYQEQAAGYRAGGADCEPAKIDSLPARKRQAKADACAEAQEQHREAADSLIENRRSAVATEAGAVAGAAQARIETWGAALGLLTLLAAVAAAWFAKKAADHTETSAKATERMAFDNATLIAASVEANNAAREANEISRQSMAAENRAWIELVENTQLGDLRFENDEFRLKVIFRLKNVGKSVARYVRSEISLVKEPVWDHGKTANPIDEITARMSADRTKWNTTYIFPDRMSEHNYETAVQTSDLQLMLGDTPSKHYPIALCFAVKYFTIFDRDDDPPHFTVMLFRLIEIDEKGRTLGMLGAKTVPAARLRLQHSIENLNVVT